MISILTELMIWNVALGGGLLTLGCLVAAMISSPVRRLRCLEWTMLVAMLAPILATTSFPWKQSLHWLPPETSVETVPLEKGTVAANTQEPKRSETPVISTSTGSIAYISLSPETAPLDAANLHAPESKLSHTNRKTNWTVTILLVYAAVIWMTVIWWAIGWFALGRWWRKGKVWSWDQLGMVCDSPMGKVEVRSHPGVNTPCAFGWWRWKILIPEHLVDSKHRKQLRMACAHEWSHLSRGDLWTWRWTRFAQLAFWMQPAYWWMRSQVRLCQDYLADSEAAATSGHTNFAAFLLSVARTQQTVPGAVLSLKSKKSDLTRRIRMLIESKGVLETSCPRFMQGAVSFLVCGVLGVSALFQLDAQNERNPITISHEGNSSKQGSKLRLYHGEVLDHDLDTPILGATVTVRRILTNDPRYGNVESHLLQETIHTCDAQGQYRFEVSDAHYAEPNLYIELDVSHPDYVDQKGFGWGMSVIERNAKFGDRPFYEKIKLYRGRKVVGKLLTPNGLPAGHVKIEGSTYEYSETKGTKFSGGGDILGGIWISGITDSQGHFEITVLKNGVAVVGFQLEGYPTLVKGVEVSSSDMGSLSLKGGFTLEGLLLDADGRPVKGLSVSASKLNVIPEFEGSEWFSGILPIGIPEAVSGEDGRFSLLGMEEGDYSFQIDPQRFDEKEDLSAEQSKTYSGAFISSLESVYNDHKVKVFKAHSTAFLHVRQTDPDGNPVKGQEVNVSGTIGHIRNYKESFFSVLRPTENGFSTLEVPKGLYANISTPMSNYYSYQISIDPNEPNHKRGDAHLGLITDDISDIRIIHYKSPIVLVKVVDEQGINVPDITVSGFISNLPQQKITFDHQTDGRWRSVGMQTYQRTQIAASKEGYYDATQYVSDLVAEEVREITLVMRKKS